MSYCLNPHCASPQNPDSDKFCSTCGFRLLLGDRYRAVRPIGRGGFGKTFRAVDEYKPSRPACVIKQFLPLDQSVLSSRRARELFRQEAMRLEQLGTHAQIPALLAHFEQADYQYLVQEFIDGPNLLEAIAQQGVFSDRQVWQLLDDLLPVLEFIHHHQVIHRDIKPQNIIRRTSTQQTQQYVLVDFGAAKSIEGSDLMRTGTSIGSPEFTAPEQTIGKSVYASDLYSLGVTCIYLLTQVRPADLYDTEEGLWIWRRHLPQPLNTVLCDLLDKLLKAPTRLRYQSAIEVRRDLHDRAILQELGIEQEKDDEIESAGDREVLDLGKTALPLERRGWRCVETLRGHQSWVRSVVLHPIGKTLASGSGDRTIKFWDAETGELLRTLAAHDSWVRTIAVSPDGQMLASASNDKTVKLWRWETGELLHTLTGHTDWVRSVSFSPNGRILASTSQDQTVRVWRVATGELLQTLQGHRHWGLAVLFLLQPDRPPLVSSSRDKTVRVWDWQQGNTIALLEGHTDAVNGLAATKDTIASASEDGTVKLWDWESGLRRTLSGHEGAVYSVKFHPTGDRLISCGQDRTLKLWEPNTGELLHTLTGHENWVWSIAWDGTTIASASWDGTVKLWQEN
ncbi:MAG TPA: serine/threonine-protein kinase [Thermosynechococcaceae cyanobacterium]